MHAGFPHDDLNFLFKVAGALSARGGNCMASVE